MTALASLVDDQDGDRDVGRARAGRLACAPAGRRAPETAALGGGDDAGLLAELPASGSAERATGEVGGGLRRHGRHRTVSATVASRTARPSI